MNNPNEIIPCNECGEQTIAARPKCRLCVADEGLFKPFSAQQKCESSHFECPKCGEPCNHTPQEMQSFAYEALEEVSNYPEFDPNRGAKQLIGVTIARVDASAINEIKLIGDDGVEYTFAAESGPLGIPVVYVTKYPK